MDKVLTFTIMYTKTIPVNALTLAEQKQVAEGCKIASNYAQVPESILFVKRRNWHFARRSEM
jgi:hypothetical protein